MLHLIFDHPDWQGAGVIAAKTAVVYVFLVAGLRLLGKRELGQMSLYDLVLIVILGNAVQNAMINGDNTLLGGVVAGCVLLVLNRLLHELTVRYRPAERLLIGEPCLLVHDGQILAGHMRREGITRDQLDAALREHGFNDPSEARAVVLEVDGTVSVVSKSGTMHRTRPALPRDPAAVMLLALAPVNAERVEVQVIKTLIIMVLLVVGFRLFGKREAAQLNVYDLAMLMALANAVQNAMTEGLGNLPIGLAASTTIVIAAWVLSRLLLRRPGLEGRFVGTPTVLVNNGRVVTAALRRQQVTKEELADALRQRGVDKPRDARLVVLETDGSISVVPFNPDQ